MYANRDIKAYKKKEAHKTASHAFRADPENENVDYSRTVNNVVVLGADNYEDYKKDLANAIALTDKSRRGKKVRIDANLVINQVFNASPEYFFDFKKAGITLEQWQNLEPKNPDDVKKIREVWKTLDKDKLEQYQRVIIEHLQACHKHTISLVLHLDEKSPHWHASSVPIVENTRGELTLSAKQYYKKATLSQWNKDFKARINKLGLAFSKPEPDVKLSPENFSVAEQLSKPAPPKSRRRSAYEPKKKMGVFYTEQEVQKLKKSYEDREKNLKEIIANHYKFYDDNAEKIRQFNNLQAKHSVALKELQQLREYKNYTRNYRKLVANEKKMRLEIEQQKEQILELKKEREELLQELHKLKPEQKIRLESAHKNIESLKKSTRLSSNRGYTP
jgi:hypothetical protein